MHGCEVERCYRRQLHGACLGARGRRADGEAHSTPQQAPPPRLARRDPRRPGDGVEPTGRGDQPGISGQGRNLALGARAAGCGFSLRDALLRPRHRGRGEKGPSRRSRRAGFGRPRLPRRERVPRRAGTERPQRRASNGRRDRKPEVLDGVGERIRRAGAGPGQARHLDGDALAPGPRPEALGRADPHGLARVRAPSGSIRDGRPRWPCRAA